MMRNGNIQDMDFIQHLILAEAKNGHFNCELLSSKGKICLGLDLTSILTSKVRLNGLRAYALILEEDEQPVGFVIMSALSENKGNELWMAAVGPAYRAKGYGKRMVLEILNHFKNKNLILTARCSQKSEAMYHILTSNGFKYILTGEHDTRALVYLN